VGERRAEWSIHEPALPCPRGGLLGPAELLRATSIARQYFLQGRAKVDIGVSEGSQLHPLLEPHTLATLSAKDMAAEVCSIPLAEGGTPVHADLAERTIGIDFDVLGKIPEVIAVAGGESKARGIRTVLRGGLAHFLVVDDRAARRVLALHS
jgi:DNA-binding transcriptional regulator LsrR (DeoR family)